MITEIRDPQFARFVDEFADSLEAIDVSFSLNSWEVFVGTVVTVYDAFATPETAWLQQAMSGIAI